MTGNQLVLLLDPQQPERDQITQSLHSQGYLPLAVGSSAELLQRCQRELPSAVILANPLSQPGEGCRICRQLKQEASLPVVLIAGSSQELELFDCYDSGADACLQRPLSLPLLSARLRAMLRRGRPTLQGPIRLGEYELQPRMHLLLHAGQRVPLTPREFNLLCYLVEHKNQALTRAQLLRAVWGPDYHGDARTVDTHIKCLRRKLEGLEDCLVTLHRVGYKFIWKEPMP